MVNFTSIIEPLANDVVTMISAIGFTPHMYKIRPGLANKHSKYVVRVSKNVSDFLNAVQCIKE